MPPRPTPEAEPGSTPPLTGELVDPVAPQVATEVTPGIEAPTQQVEVGDQLIQFGGAETAVSGIRQWLAERRLGKAERKLDKAEHASEIRQPLLDVPYIDPTLPREERDRLKVERDAILAQHKAHNIANRPTGRLERRHAWRQEKRRLKENTMRSRTMYNLGATFGNDIHGGPDARPMPRTARERRVLQKARKEHGKLGVKRTKNLMKQDAANNGQDIPGRYINEIRIPRAERKVEKREQKLDELQMGAAEKLQAEIDAVREEQAELRRTDPTNRKKAVKLNAQEKKLLRKQAGL